MASNPMIINLLGSAAKQKDTEELLRDLLSGKQNLVEPEEIDQDPTLAEKIVGGYVASSSIPSDPSPQEFFDKLPNLKVMSFFGTGVNRISLEWARKKGLRIGHTGTEVCADTADIAIIHMAVTARKFLQSK